MREFLRPSHGPRGKVRTSEKVLIYLLRAVLELLLGATGDKVSKTPGERGRARKADNRTKRI